MRRVVRVVWSNAWWSRHMGPAGSFRVPSELLLLHGCPDRFEADLRVWVGATGSGDDMGSGLVPLGRRRVTVTAGAFGMRIPPRIPGQLPGDPEVPRPEQVEALFVLDAVDGVGVREPEPSGEVVDTAFASQFQAVSCRLQFWRWPHELPPRPPRVAAPPTWFARWWYAMDRCGHDEPYVGAGALTADLGLAGLRWAEVYALDTDPAGWLHAERAGLPGALARVGEAADGLVELKRSGPRFRGGPWGSSANLLWRPAEHQARVPLSPQLRAEVLISALDVVLGELPPAERSALLDGVDALLALHRPR